MNLYFENVDIYNQVSINQCIYDSYGEEQPDTLRVVFNDTSDLWDGWSPEKGNKIRAVLGACDTGNMYISSVKPENGKMCLRASAAPATHNNKSNKSWSNVRFKQICNEIGSRHALTCEFYGVEDQVYEYVNQQNKEDFVFLEERCVLEGCAFLVYNDKMIIYSEEYIENTSTNEKLVIGNDVKFEYLDDQNNAYGTCVLKNGSITGTYSTGVNDKVLNKTMSIKISSQAEANRYAKNILRYENKKMTSATCQSGTFMPGYAAGSLVNLQAKGASSWNVPVVMSHVRHDLVKAKTKLFFRKTLEV